RMEGYTILGDVKAPAPTRSSGRRRAAIIASFSARRRPREEFPMPDEAPNPEAEDLPSFKIEQARSGRSKCKGCRRPIQKDKVRIGIRIEGPFGPGYLWHHLSCAMRRRPEDVERAYAERAWEE